MAKKNTDTKLKKGQNAEMKIEDLFERLRVINFKTEGSKSKNVKETQNIKKQIARILTIQNQK